jgi:hypothetical protein
MAVASKARRWIALASLGAVSAASAPAAYVGPVPAPTDGFGARGPYAVRIETFPSPGWAGQVVTVHRPEGATGRRPVWFFAHGFGGNNAIYYDELLTHLASHGSVVVFSPYPTNFGPIANNYAIVFDGFAAAVDRLRDVVDTNRVGFAGHSYGAGGVPALALRGIRERGWGADGLALLMLAPWFSASVTDADLASFPAGTQAVMQIYEDDLINDHRMAVDLFTHLNLPAADKDFLLMRSDRIDGYNYTSDHRVPTGAGNEGRGIFDALDAWGVLRIAQALSASALDKDPAGRAVALGNGAAEQVQMGVTPDGRALRPMVQTDAPVPLFPSSRYFQRFDGMLNPRANAALPAPATAARLVNLSVRTRSAEGEDVLIAGAVLAGPRPKSLLIRAVGPGLAGQGVVAPMPDPELRLHRGASLDLAMDDWSETPEPETLIAATAERGAFELAEGSRDAALLASFSPGVLTALVPAGEGGPGEALVEFYEADDDASARLVNLSARGRVDENNALIAGFVTSGPGPLRLLVRAIGPTLATAGVAAPLANPRLEVFQGSERIAQNDDWSADAALAAEISAVAQQVGAAPLPAGSADASVVITLPPGVYTAHVRGAAGQSGIALVEVYAVP